MFNNIEVLLYIPKALLDYREELEKFIIEKTETTKDIKVVSELSKDTQIVISLITDTLSKSDKIYHKKYQNREFRFLFYYFQDVELSIDDFSDEVFDRVEFKSEVERDTKLYNSFEGINDIKRSLEVNLKEAIFDIEHKTNYSKINSSVISRSKGDRFYDHDNNLRRVDNFLRRAKRVSLINGFGGVGKTTLAIEYAKNAVENEIYDYLIWLDIEKGIDNEIRTFAIKFLLSDMEDGKQEYIYYQRTFEKFIANYPNSLIILDNYTHSIVYQEKLQNFLKNFSSTDIIITSREDISKIVDSKPIRLEVFQTLDDALEMFRLNSTRSYSHKEEQSLRKIIQYLGNLPLALEITANFLDDTNMSVDEYLQALEDEGLKLFDKISDYKPKNHLDGLKATLKINEKIRENENSLKLLKAFALISPEPINQNIIEEYLVEELTISAFDKTVSLRDLEKFSYIKLSKDNYSMHRLLQQSIIDDCFVNNQDEQKEMIIKISLAIFNWFRNGFEEHNYGTYFSETVKHINYLLEEWSSIIPNEAKIYLYTCLSAYTENPKETLKNIEKVIKLLNVVKINEREKGIVYNQYGLALRLNSEYNKALKYYKKSLDINIKIFGSNHIEIANSYYAFGGVYNDKEEYSKAFTYHNKALNIRLDILGKDNLYTADSYNEIGLLYRYKLDSKNALLFYKKALNIYLKNKNNYHPNIAVIYRNIGLVYKNLKECKKAKESLQKALDIRLDLEIDEDVLNLKSDIKEIDKNIQKEQKQKYNKKGRYCKDA